MPQGVSESCSKRQKVEHTCDVDLSMDNGRPVETVLRPKDEGITFKVYTNDGKVNNNLALIMLKNIFSKQLPKMPKEYIVRLVFDKRHYTVAILHNERIIGGVCYRPYHTQHFAEIAFLAISGTEQVKGYGTLLMNHLKNHVQKEGVEYFLTYADNYAIGYFQKQGFSKQVVMPKDRWTGFIKDYDGGTLMECFVHPAMDYLRVPEIIAKQRAFIFGRLQARVTTGAGNSILGPAAKSDEAPSQAEAVEAEADNAPDAASSQSTTSGRRSAAASATSAITSQAKSNHRQQKELQQQAAVAAVYSSSATVYDGLELFKQGQRLHSVLDVPGVMSAGWKAQHLFTKPPTGGSTGSSGSVGASERDRNIALSKLSTSLRSALDKLVASKHSWPFLEAVSRTEVPEYYDEIAVPMDLSIVTDRLRDSSSGPSSGEAYFRCREMMYADLMLVVSNCKQFNDKGSEYYTEAQALEEEIKELFSDVHSYVTAQEAAFKKSQASLGPATPEQDVGVGGSGVAASTSASAVSATPVSRAAEDK